MSCHFINNKWLLLINYDTLKFKKSYHDFNQPLKINKKHNHEEYDRPTINGSNQNHRHRFTALTPSTKARGASVCVCGWRCGPCGAAGRAASRACVTFCAAPRSDPRTTAPVNTGRLTGRVSRARPRTPAPPPCSGPAGTWRRVR